MKGMVPSKNAPYRAALYLRLSKDDESAAESASIQTQRTMLRAYAEEKGFEVYGEYIDDGVSGTTFDRPGFQRLLHDIREKKVNLVLTKDLSRLGRDYITTGQYTEIYFPSMGVRYIAVNDGYDSDSPYTDIAPFKNVVNELYARDTSKKIRSALTARMREGAFMGAFPPYGYRRDPADKHHLVIDETSAQTVLEIFKMAAGGLPPVQIARELNFRRIPTPMEYRCMQNPGMEIENFTKRREWTPSTISKLLKNTVYLGIMAQGKTTKISFKCDVTLARPKEDWLVVPDTHEPVVTPELFHLARQKSGRRACRKVGRFHNVFSGVAKCADCGKGMSSVGTRKKGASANLACGGYKLHGKSACTNHFIDYDALCKIVLDSIKEMARLSPQEEREILSQAQGRLHRRNSLSKNGAETGALQKRRRELDILFEKLYEDHAKGILPSDQMEKLLLKYNRESEAIAARLQSRTKPASDPCRDMDSGLKSALLELTSPDVLTQELLYQLIDHIEIGQGAYLKNSKEKIKQQTIKIFFRFSGSSVSKTVSLP